MQLYITFYSLLLLFIALIFLFLPHPIYVVLVSLVFIFTIRLFPRSNSGIIKCIYKNEAIKLFRRQKPNSFLKESLGNFHLFNKWHNQYFISNHFNHIKPNLSIDLFNYKYLFNLYLCILKQNKHEYITSKKLIYFDLFTRNNFSYNTCLID